MKTRFIILGSALVAATAIGQYAIEWSTIDGGGGGVSSGGKYRISGTIGQSDASAVSTGGDYVTGSGFWYGIIRVPGDPELRIARLPSGGVRVFWKDPEGAFILQESSPPAALEPGDFTEISGPYPEENGEFYHEITSPVGQRFFRVTKR
jgi:hypothetical protein